MTHEGLNCLMTKQQIISPVDGSVYVERDLATPQQIETTLEKASKAWQEWRTLSVRERADYCTRMVEHVISNVDDIATELSWQMGRPIAYTPFEIKRGFAERSSYMISVAEKALEDVEVEPKEGFTRFIRREPLGVVLTVAPWNYPYLTSVNSIIPALMAGNTVLLKHAAQTPLCAERYFEAAEAAGLPEGVFQYLHLTHHDVANVIADERIAFVAFTGSLAGGHAVQQAASSRFIATGLELGGKDPAYVRADANLNHAIENLVEGSFFNSGQSCCGIEKIYVHRDVYKEFLEGFVELTKLYKLGNPLDPNTTLGPVVRTSAADFVRGQIAEAIDGGAKPLLDPALFSENKEGTPYLAPQVLVNVDHGMRVMSEETFGPVVGIMQVTSDEEAIHLMNDSQYGLTASVWTVDEDAAVNIGNQINTGTVYMNRCDYLDPALAWTGVKDSGRGCTLSVLGYEALTRPKSFHLRSRL
jgi:acyl-CoA reductase-like NAD-dependent aldehyde dehydrogenase